MLTQVTGIVVTHNTKEIFERAYTSVRRFHPDMPLIIIDGSDAADPCAAFVASLKGGANMVYQLGYNIGHGRGLHYGLQRCPTPLALCFDSDIVMLQSPLAAMVELISPDVYGVGWITEVGDDGFDFGTPDHGHVVPVPYLHPYFMLLNLRQYFTFAPAVHHGAPMFKAMNDLHCKGQSGRLRSFTGLTGHTSGEGINWRGTPNAYIQHDFGGTRTANRRAGAQEIEGVWER